MRSRHNDEHRVLAAQLSVVVVALSNIWAPSLHGLSPDFNLRLNDFVASTSLEPTLIRFDRRMKPKYVINYI